MLSYNMPLYRPPSEGDNLIIQATLGCSFNRCAFCSMYHSKQYQARPLDQVFHDIDKAARVWPEARRVFLADGDALTLDMDSLRAILDKLSQTFPDLQRVTCYATPANLLAKTPEDLAELKSRKLSLVYFGIESGSPDILKKITKGASQKGMITALSKAYDAGIKVSATVILGLGGQKHWQNHIEGTLALLAQAPVTYLSTLQLYLEASVREDFLARFDDGFVFQDDAGILREQRHLLANITPVRPIIFRSNHASNALALAGNLPKDRDRLLAEIDYASTHAQMLRPAFLRGL